jgi:REP element-mobilizing transposase RayT
MRSYRRRLPHVDAPGLPAFVTWRVYGSLPEERAFPREHLSSSAAFAAFDQLLDSARTGPLHLRRPEIAVLVRDQLRQVSADGWCSLHAFVVMPNHVHVLWTPLRSLPTLLRQVKGPSALAANRLLGNTGEPFWQSEYFDRQVRNEHEFARIQRYIEWNPVKAGLVARPEEFPWSSAYTGGRASARAGL